MTSIFDGDGRRKVQPTGDVPGTRPMAVSRSTARILIEHFSRTGYSTHSSMGATLWVILQHCDEQEIAYTLHAQPRMGYTVEVLR